MTEKPSANSQSNAAEGDLCFGNLFARVDKEFSRYSPPVVELGDKYVEALSVSAMAKCLDFNIAAHDVSEGSLEPFFLAANCRSICEELIYVAFFRSLDSRGANEIAMAISEVMHRKSVLSQTRFFAANNSLQPTHGALVPATEQQQSLRSAEQRLSRLWSQHGFSESGRTTVRDVSRRVRLNTTYDYVYHMTSNYVHFNPTHLFKMGWGPMEGPFTFSVKHFDGYYRHVARFLGAMFFMGYVLMFSKRLSKMLSKEYIEIVTATLESNIRWPEVITFEEMNQHPPANIMYRALMTMLRKEDSGAYPSILEELKSLANSAPQ